MNPKRLIELMRQVNLMTGSNESSVESKLPFDQEKEKFKYLEPKDIRNWALTRLGHEGMMLEKIYRQNRVVEKSATQGVGSENSGVSSELTKEDEEGMGVSIGNEHHYHNVQPDNGDAKNNLPMLLGAGLIGAGLYFGLKDKESPPIDDKPPAATTEVRLGFGTPEYVDTDKK